MAKKKVVKKTDPGFPKQLRSQKELVTEILNSGIEKPALIIAEAKKKFGVDIAAPNVNQIKMKWKKTRKASPGLQARIRKAAKAGKLPKSAASPASAASQDTVSAVLELVRLVGVDKAEALLTSLRK